MNTKLYFASVIAAKVALIGLVWSHTQSMSLCVILLSLSVMQLVHFEAILNITKSMPSEEELDELEDDFLNDKVRLVKLLQKSDKAPLTRCNKVEILKNGEIKFKKLFQDLEKAKHHIHVEYYIVKDDKIGSQLLNILCKKAKEGIEVRLSVDDVGADISRKMKHKLKNCGVEFFSFMPVLFPKFTGRMNYRNHRKIAIIDGLVGYVGGINVSDNYVNKADRDFYWRDTSIRVEGEAVITLQVQFLTNWQFVSNSKIENISK